MRKRIAAALAVFIVFITGCIPVYGQSLPREETPDYKVAFYPFDSYHMQASNGRKYGYGYEMMQNISKHMQCTFSYVGYDKSAGECIEMLRNGELDIYTAAKKTEERLEEFAFSKHPAITASTCMNVRRDNEKIVKGDYSTYDGIKVGFLKRHTYNEDFLAFAGEKGFQCEIVYFDTQTELSNALISGQVDAVVNSYIRAMEDEKTIEEFGETSYYIMARKEDAGLIEQIDKAIDAINIETPNWRSELYTTYYGSQPNNVTLSKEEQMFLEDLRENHAVIRAAMAPDTKPYSWFEDGKACGILADIFETTAKRLGLDYEIVPVENKRQYDALVQSGAVDIWIDMDSFFEDEENYKYNLTEVYLTTPLSILYKRGSSPKINKVGIVENNRTLMEVVTTTWPHSEMVPLHSSEEGIEYLISNRIDCVLMKSYVAQNLESGDVQNRLSTVIVQGSELELKMGINSKLDYRFGTIWEKTLRGVVSKGGESFVQGYLQSGSSSNLMAFLFDHPVYMALLFVFIILPVFHVFLYIQSTKARKQQMEITKQLETALQEAKAAEEARSNFFSKMSHDIRTPLNAVLGMTQIARKYKNEEEKLEDALSCISSEGNYLLTMINSILDINQLDYGHIELVRKPFALEECIQECVHILEPLAAKKELHVTISTDCGEHVVVGDAGRFNQIVVNIVSNAIKYTDVGGSVYVSLECLPKHRYRFTCKDTGIGMSEEFVEHICEEYSRAEDSRISTVEGTGLGMAVVKGFIELMKGTLQIESKLGEGSTFIVELPFEEATPQQKEAIRKTVVEDFTTYEQLEGKRVLLVEDNALNAEIATELLESLGLVVEWANNGSVGVDKFLESPEMTYFAIFMDMQMPVMDGIEATKSIRNSNRADSNVRIFAMTANTLEKDQQACMEAGMDGYISKPISLKAIVKAMNEI